MIARVQRSTSTSNLVSCLRTQERALQLSDGPLTRYNRVPSLLRIIARVRLKFERSSLGVNEQYARV